MIPIWPLVFTVIGLLMWVLAKDKIAEVGRLMFFCGLLWLVYGLSGHTLKFAGAGEAPHGEVPHLTHRS